MYQSVAVASISDSYAFIISRRSRRHMADTPITEKPEIFVCTIVHGHPRSVSDYDKNNLSNATSTMYTYKKR